MSRMGLEIMRLRKEVGMTQKQLAKAVGVAESFIIDVESGKRVIKEDLIKRISKALRKEVSNLDVYEEKVQPEPVKNVVKVVEKPVQDIWNDALSGVLMPVPVYTYEMDQAINKKQMPIINNKIEGFSKEKVFYIVVDDNDMLGFRLLKGDTALVHSTHEIEKDAIFFIEHKNKRMIRQIKVIDGGKLLLVSNMGSLITETVYKKDIKVLGRLIRLEITL